MTRLNKSSICVESCRRLSSIFNNGRTLGGAILVIFLVQLSLVQPALSGINHNEFLAQLKVPQCRKDCLDKVSMIQIVFFLFSVSLKTRFKLKNEFQHMIKCGFANNIFSVKTKSNYNKITDRLHYFYCFKPTNEKKKIMLNCIDVIADH